MTAVLVGLWTAPCLAANAPEDAESQAFRPDSPTVSGARAAPMDVCGTHESILKFARDAGRLVSGKDAPYFAVKERLIRVNERYVAMYETLAAVLPPKDDAAAEVLWRFDALGELLQESGQNLERQARELKTANRLCGADLAGYEAEFGDACPADAEPGCAEAVFAGYCAKAQRRNRALKVDEETQLGMLKWPRFFDHHWSGPTQVGEAGEGWREEWTYGSDDEVWENLGRELALDENRLLNLARVEATYSHYTMIDTKPLFVRMVYNVLHGAMASGHTQSLATAVDVVVARVSRVMRCDLVQMSSSKPMRLLPPADADAAPVSAERAGLAGAE